MLSTRKLGKVTWCDLSHPNAEEIEELAKKYKLSDLTKKELETPSERPKVDRYNSYIYAILHFPVYQHDHGAKDTKEIDFIIGKDFLITCRYQNHEDIESMLVEASDESFFSHGEEPKHGGFLFYEILRNIYEALERDLYDLNDNLSLIEESIFEGKEREMVPIISIVNHDLLDFKKSLKRHDGILSSLRREGKEFFGTAFEHYLEDMHGEFIKIWNQVLDSKELLDDLRTTNDSILSTKTNETMKVLTVMAFMTFPLTLLAGIFGMNAVNMPLVGHPQDFWILVAVMIVGVLLMLLYFRHKKWF